MIKRTLPYVMAAGVLMMAFVMPVHAAVEIGKPAPAIEATDINGNAVNLADHKGEIVVLEWTNAECPFVVKHYDSGNMQKLQKAATEKGVKWITINSSAEGKQGNISAEDAKTLIEEVGAAQTAYVQDPSGTIGQAYGAKTTPHMYVIDKDGNVAYAGAIDSNSSPRASTIEGAENYVMAAVDSLMAGEPVKTAETAPYGCAVKY